MLLSFSISPPLSISLSLHKTSHLFLSKNNPSISPLKPLKAYGIQFLHRLHMPQGAGTMKLQSNRLNFNKINVFVHQVPLFPMFSNKMIGHIPHYFPGCTVIKYLHGEIPNDNVEVSQSRGFLLHNSLLKPILIFLMSGELG